MSYLSRLNSLKNSIYEFFKQHDPRTDMFDKEYKIITHQIYNLALTPNAEILLIDENNQSAVADISHATFLLGDRLALRLPPNQTLISDDVFISSEHVLMLKAGIGLPTTNRVTLSVSLELRISEEHSENAHILTQTFGSSPCLSEQEIELSLRSCAGHFARLRVECTSGDGACLIARLSVCPREKIGLVNALSAYPYRLGHEIAHFSGIAYTHAMYGPSIHRENLKSSIQVAKPRETSTDFLKAQETFAKSLLSEINPTEHEAIYNFAMRCLGALIPVTPPDFFSRIRNFSPKNPLRILSICAGAARVEESIIEHCTNNIDITLLDASEELIGRASQRLQSLRPGIKVNCLLGDINDGLPGDNEFDIIICVSALHHVANLEKVLSQINERLTENGEFWSIGEQIGRNGNRLWPEALQKANEIMAKLPERLRKNAHTGNVDTVLPDRDFSIECFEGIRSEELEEKLEAYLIPLDVYKRNAFLWRLVDITYADNYLISSDEDISYLKEIVLDEVLLWLRGGRSTELHGAYRKKQVTRRVI